MRTALVSILVLTALWTSSAHSHGEDRPGPHGGYVRMPSNYHTEIVLENNHTLKVYLLDINWRNPVVRNSSVQLSHTDNRKKQDGTAPAVAQCETQDSHFLCRFPDRINLRQSGELKLISQRDGQKGVEVSYPLPLRLEKPAGSPETEPGTHQGHGGHH